MWPTTGSRWDIRERWLKEANMGKIFLIIFLLIFPFTAYAGVPILGGGVAVEEGCDDCSGTLIWASHFEGTGNSGQTFDITTNSPCGCSDNASKLITYFSAAANSNDFASDGSYSFKQATDADYATSPLTGASVSAVSIQFDLYFTTWDESTELIKLRYDGSNLFYCGMSGTDEIACSWTGNGTTKVKISSDWNLATSNWYTIRAQARVGTSPYIRMTKNGGSAQTYTTADNVAMTNATNVLWLGDASTDAPVMYIDKVYAWSDWQTGADWGD